MPTFHPMQDAYPRSDYPPQYLHLKYEGSTDFRIGHSATHAASTSELDLLHHPDPYNYGKHASATQSTYQMYGSCANDAFGLGQRLGAPVIQPLHTDNRYVPHGGRSGSNGAYGGRRNYPQTNSYEERLPQQEDKVVGGVSAQLDYEMSQMTDFVVEMACGMYALFTSRVCMADIDIARSVKPPVCEQPLFRKWVLQVLNATRLPSATIVLSLSYLALRVRGMSATGYYVPTERGLYQMLTVALILGSKFLDDNTFQNKSWAEVSNIPVRDLNKDEILWLEAFGHRLHYDPDMADGFNSWQKQWDGYKARSSLSTSTLHPLDTSVRGARSGRQSTSPSRYAHQYNTNIPVNSLVAVDPAQTHVSYTPTYSPFQSWFGQRSTQGSSPSTAPHTGPTTPEYYSSAWGQTRAYSARDVAYDFATLPHFTPNFGSGYEPQAYDCTLPSVWNCHGQTCQCSNCRQAQLAPRYGPITAA